MLRFHRDGSVRSVAHQFAIVSIPQAGYLKVFYDDLAVKKYSSQLTVIYNKAKDEFTSLTFDYVSKGDKSGSISFNMSFVDSESLLFTIIDNSSSGSFQQVTAHNVQHWTSELANHIKELVSIEMRTLSSEHECELSTQIIESFKDAILPYMRKSIDSWAHVDFQNIVDQLETIEQLMRASNTPQQGIRK